MNRVTRLMTTCMLITFTSQKKPRPYSGHHSAVSSLYSLCRWMCVFWEIELHIMNLQCSAAFCIPFYIQNNVLR